MSAEHKEIEVRFLDIDKEKVIRKLRELGAEDLGEEMLEEIIFRDARGEWTDKLVRLRKGAKGLSLSYKHHKAHALDGAEEVEFFVDTDISKAKTFLERVGLVAVREQQKKRHSFRLRETAFDIDTWPRIPTYIEIEGPSEDSLKKAAQDIGLDWADAIFENALAVIEGRYKIFVGKMKYFTFDRFE